MVAYWFWQKYLFLFDVKLGLKEDKCSPSVVLVISPLVSLMSDQVSSLRRRGVAAAILSSHDICDKSFLATDKDLQTPGMLFASPEAVIGATRWRERLMTYPLSERIVALAIDEAHCISKWYVTSHKWMHKCALNLLITLGVVPSDLSILG